MTLRDLLYGLTPEPVSAVPVSGLAIHSKRVRSGDLFVAVRGASADGHEFIDEAIQRGASAIVAERLPASTPGLCPCVVVPDSKAALAAMAAKFYGRPSKRLKLLGVTGTNGKTTTTYLLKSVLEASGASTGLLGTIQYQIGDRMVPSGNTTPGPLELQRFFAQMVAEGLQWCAMEVSSHALAQNRIAGLELEAAIFSNLGSDHLDYHKTIEAYAAAKRRLFDYLKPDGIAVINADDPFGRTLAETLPNHRVITYAVEHHARVRVRMVECSWQGTYVLLETPWGVVPLTSPLLGRHNVSNMAAAAATLLALGVSATAIQRGLSELRPIPGRLERVPHDGNINVLIDYAHTADALRLVLLALRELTRGRLIVVFGCGGNRDETKRPIMGRMASLLADQVLLTSDNPRQEPPLAILRQIQSGFAPGFSQFQVVPEREQAIALGLSMAQPGDTVLIAGKGHESYQIFDHVTIPFSDRDVVGRLLDMRQPSSAVTTPAEYSSS